MTRLTARIVELIRANRARVPISVTDCRQKMAFRPRDAASPLLELPARQLKCRQFLCPGISVMWASSTIRATGSLTKT